MNGQTVVVTILVGMIILTAGCENAPLGYNVEHGDGELTVTNGTFQMTGEVTASRTRGAPHRTFENVSIVLYDSEQHVIKEVELGNLSTSTFSPGGPETPVNVTSTEIPKYVLFESADFWTIEEDIVIEAFVRENTGFESYNWRNESDKFDTSQ